MNPLNTVAGAVTTGVILAILLMLGIGPGHLNVLSLARWFHILAGVMWIGLLFYFNVVQIPGVAAAGADKGGPGGAGISKYIAPRALLWFRWAAVATWLTGAWYLGGNFVNAFTFKPGFVTIGVGAWLGTIMLLNVWGVIWPNQKKALGLVPADDAAKAKARRIAMLASRTNFVLSVPMLVCMAGASHGLPF